jgi:hypothetical protein
VSAPARRPVAALAARLRPGLGAAATGNVRHYADSLIHPVAFRSPRDIPEAYRERVADHPALGSRRSRADGEGSWDDPVREHVTRRAAGPGICRGRGHRGPADLCRSLAGAGGAVSGRAARRRSAATDIDREHDPTIRRPGQRQRCQCLAQTRRFQPAVTERVVHRSVPAPVFGHRRQIDQRPHRPVGAQHRIGQLEQRVCPRGQAPVELHPEPSKLTAPSRVAILVSCLHQLVVGQALTGQSAFR